MSKIIRTQKPSVLPWYAAALVFAVLCAALPAYKLWALLAALGGAFVAFGAAQKVCPPRVVEHEVPFHTGVEDVDQMLTDIQQKLDTLHALNETLPDPQLSAAMTRMEKAGRSIVETVEANPAKAKQVRRFANYYLPDAVNVLQQYAQLARQGVRLMITVDCGSTAVEEVAYASGLGIDVIITDHHECKEEIPAAVAVVDPHRPDCTYPFPYLAGCGVALKLVLALGGPDRENALFARYCTLAAIGTNVGHNAVAAFVHAKLLAQVGDGGVNVAQQCSVRFGKLCRRFNMLLGDHQKMHRCLRVNIIKCQQSVILIQLIGRDLARCDFAKQAVIHRFCPLSQRAGRLARHPKIVQLYYRTLSLLFPGFLSQCLPQRSVHRRSWKYRGYRPWRSPACRRRCRLQWQRSA